MVRKKGILFFAALLLLCSTMVDSASAMVPYKTYFYDYEGDYFVSPDAYVPYRVLNAKDMGVGNEGLNQPMDLFVDENNLVYVADSGRNRILLLDEQYQLKREINEFVLEDGVTKDSFNNPIGLFVSKEGLIYVADSKNARIVVLRQNGTLERILEAPDSEVFPAGFIYEPSALSVDPAGRIYVISKSTNMGVIALNADGGFEGFEGAEKVVPKVTDLFWKLVTTKEQKSRTAKSVPTEYNNITIDELGFSYVTSSALEARNQWSAMKNRDKSSRHAPIKRLNNLGIDVLKRNGAFPPAGDIQTNKDVSRFIDVSLAQDGVYSTLDSTQNKIFTYDDEGNLLYAFGGYGSQNGVFQSASALAYQGSNLLVLDKDAGKLTVFKRTEYGDDIAAAIHARKTRKYDDAIAAWQRVLEKNPSLELAYSGVAQSNMRKAEYREAMKNYKLANDWEHYFKAFAEYRKEKISKLILLIPILAVILFWLLYRFFKYVKKRNSSGWRKEGKRTLWEELLYAFHVILHPFDGFWDLKHEKRGSMRGALIIVGLVMAADIFKKLAGGYILYPTDWRVIELQDTVLSVLIPFGLWCCVNWGLTTLMDGEGSLKDIFIASAYSLTPIVMISIPVTIISNFASLQEQPFVAFFTTLSLAWSLGLIFIGVLVTNDYTPFKNLYVSVISLIGMGFVAFLTVLFINILQNMNAFFTTIFNEITFRL
ncbi:tetratricopeptide (TPR) repeat protein [Paenibacillus castaneae]|uniref:YIP1 family protein n=1 Tax=Paenibacillus castaneae TaxID=474957 RepID=UPI000C9B9ECA|nr:YIP1 family protein [Paenibacillus castaneae]NIK75289.1 tetratricopeptide (TPR) repeat protein [Paenibacillus castaneae]